MTGHSSDRRASILQWDEATIQQHAETLRLRLLKQLDTLRIGAVGDEMSNKDAIRTSHALQRIDVLARERDFLARYGRQIVHDNFADGSEVVPAAIDPYLVPVNSDTVDARVFRLATLLWSVPVSRGFGRRIRYLVKDRSNGKLIGLFGLTDPVFNLSVRDQLIGWNAEDRRQRLVNVMDAHVVGAVPPYSQLIGGKLVAALMTSKDVADHFAKKYRHQSGVISGNQKKAKLALITVTSALGRSSLYNRLKLSETVEFKRIGLTKGWGHFHVPDDLFSEMRTLLLASGHAYADGHQFGQGPNWRMRVVRVALKLLEMDQNFLRHGIEREVYLAPLAHNWQEFLRGEDRRAVIERPSAKFIGVEAVKRWLIPRAERRPDFQTWTRSDTWAQICYGAHNTASSYAEQPQLI